MAITAGLDHTNGNWVVVMDGDLQDRPEVIPELYAKAQEGFDVVFVARKNRPESVFYQWVARLFYRIFQLISDTTSNPEFANFSIISRQVVEQCRNMREELRFYGGMVNWLGFSQTFITADHGVRFAGTTHYSWRKRFKLAWFIIIAHSDRPLHFSVALGLSMSTVSLLIGLYILFRALTTGIPVAGWASLMVAIFFNSGLILGVLGIIGIYLGKTFHQVKGRPLYVVSEKTGL